jgi:tetratricopeptide (TPR) repeat protein
MRSDQEIQDYLDGKLSGEALKEFEDALESDEELSQEIASLLHTEAGLRAAGYDSLKAEVQQWEQTFKLKKRGSAYLLLAIAASISLIVVVSIFVLLNNQVSSEQLFAKHFGPYEDLILIRGDAGEELPQVLINGMQAYNQQRYDEASVLLDQYVNTHETKDKLPLLYLGISQMMAGQSQEAEANFNRAMSDSRLRQQSEWYLALLLLKTNRQSDALVLFSKISSYPSHYKKMEASLIVRSIE